MAATSGVSNAESSGANKRRFADITNLEINEIVKKNDATNTRKSTEQALRLLTKYLLEKNIRWNTVKEVISASVSIWTVSLFHRLWGN
jgi:hypothetical protein